VETDKAHVADAYEQRRRFVLVLGARLAVAIVLLIATVFLNLRSQRPVFSIDQVLLYGLVATIFLLTAVYLLFVRIGLTRWELHVVLQIVFDLFSASLLVYITGVLESPFTFYFALPVVSAAIFFRRQGTFIIAGISCLLLGALVVLGSKGLLLIGGMGVQRLPQPPGRMVYQLILDFGVFFVVAWLSSYLGEQVRRTGRELRETEGNLARVSALNRDIVSSMRSGLLALDRHGNVSLLNPMAEEIIGCRASEALGRPLSEVFPALMQLLQETFVGREDQIVPREEVEHRRLTDGKTLPVGLTLSPLTHVDGSVIGTLVHMQDLSHLKQMQATMKRAERLAVVGGMAAGIAHEIRNPLAAISGAVQMLHAAAYDNDGERRLLEIVLRETKRLDDLLRDFLMFARPKEPQWRETRLRELIEETVEVFRHNPGEDRPTFECALADLTVRVDPDQVRQILWNLLRNAADAVSADGVIGVRLDREQRYDGSSLARLSVTDNGPGVPNDVRERIFEPFFSTKERGVGLGLATVLRIVESHGGSIEVDGPQGGGSRFTVWLPGVVS
jgi:two-component system sensor histidine kinase PilS (NtrC family)